MNRRLVVVAGSLFEGPAPDASPLDSRGAALLAEAVLRDTVALAETLNLGPASPLPQLVLAHPGDRPWYETRLSQFWLLIPQMGTGLTQALDNALIVLGPSQEDQTIFLGMYTPHLSHEILRQAFTALGNRDTVLGPAEGGGVYLIGVRGKWPIGMLSEARWESDHAQTDVRRALRRARLSCALLPTWYGVAAPDKLRRLSDDLSVFPDAALRHLRSALGSLHLS